MRVIFVNSSNDIVGDFRNKIHPTAIKINVSLECPHKTLRWLHVEASDCPPRIPRWLHVEASKEPPISNSKIRCIHLVISNPFV
jgi:hypothetical protein